MVIEIFAAGSGNFAELTKINPDGSGSPIPTDESADKLKDSLSLVCYRVTVNGTPNYEFTRGGETQVVNTTDWTEIPGSYDFYQRLAGEISRTCPGLDYRRLIY